MTEYIEGTIIIVLLCLIWRLRIKNEALSEENEILYREARLYSPRLSMMGRFLKEKT